MKFVNFAVIGLVLAVLTGCGTTTLSFGPSAKNPYSFGHIHLGRSGGPTAVVPEKELGENVQVEYSCAPGHRLSYKINKEEGVRVWECHTPTDVQPAARTLLAILGTSSAVPGKATDPGCPYGMVYAPTVPGQRRTCW